MSQPTYDLTMDPRYTLPIIVVFAMPHVYGTSICCASCQMSVASMYVKSELGLNGSYVVIAVTFCLKGCPAELVREVPHGHTCIQFDRGSEQY